MKKITCLLIAISITFTLSFPLAYIVGTDEPSKNVEKSTIQDDAHSNINVAESKVLKIIPDSSQTMYMLSDTVPSKVTDEAKNYFNSIINLMSNNSEFALKFEIDSTIIQHLALNNGFKVDATYDDGYNIYHFPIQNSNNNNIEAVITVVESINDPNSLSIQFGKNVTAIMLNTIRAMSNKDAPVLMVRDNAGILAVQENQSSSYSYQSNKLNVKTLIENDDIINSNKRSIIEDSSLISNIDITKKTIIGQDVLISNENNNQNQNRALYYDWVDLGSFGQVSNTGASIGGECWAACIKSITDAVWGSSHPTYNQIVTTGYSMYRIGPVGIGQITNILSRFNVLIERYPSPNAPISFNTLQTAISQGSAPITTWGVDLSNGSNVGSHAMLMTGYFVTTDWNNRLENNVFLMDPNSRYRESYRYGGSYYAPYNGYVMDNTSWSY